MDAQEQLAQSIEEMQKKNTAASRAMMDEMQLAPVNALQDQSPPPQYSPQLPPSAGMYPQGGGDMQSQQAMKLMEQSKNMPSAGFRAGEVPFATNAARSRLQKQAQQKEAEFQAQVTAAQMAQRKEGAKRVYDLTMETYKDPALAEAYADEALADPKQLGDIVEQLMESQEAQRAEGAENLREDDLEALKGEQRFHVFSKFMDEPIASAFANNTDLSVKDGIELWRKIETEGTAAQQAAFAEEVTKAGAYAQVDNTIKQISNTLGHADNFGSTGLASVFYSKIPGSEAYATLKSVDTQKAVNAFLELLNMRQASKTGGALGNVSNREIELLYSAYTALDPTMGDAFQRNMVDVLQRFERVKFMLANEKRFEKAGATAEEMFNAGTLYVNRQVASKRGTPLSDIDDLMNDPSLAKEFESYHGWSPISYKLDDDLYGLVGAGE